MNKRPILLALVILGGIFLLFLGLILAIAHLSDRGPTFAFGDKVGVIEITGVIISSKETIEDIHRFRDDRSVKSVVLRIDSPGGGVGPSQEIHEEVLKMTEVKPVVVSMGSVAASGGYYIAAPTQKILANPGTITGSIGVIMEYTSVQELLEKLGLRTQVVKSGEHKDIGSPFRPMTDPDRAILQALIDDVHDQFVTAVSEGRKMEPEKVRKLADGRIFTGRQAQQAGLVDELGNLEDAIAAAAELGGIVGEPSVVYPPRRKERILDYLVEETMSRLQHGLRESTSAGLLFLWSGAD